MDTYMMMLYVSLEQERAIKQFFLEQGWEYHKPDLSILTDSIGPLVAQIPHTEKTKARKKKPEPIIKKASIPQQSSFSSTKTLPPHTSASETPDQSQSPVKEPTVVLDMGSLPSTSTESGSKKRKLDGSEAKMTQTPIDASVTRAAVPVTTGPIVNLDGTTTVDTDPVIESADASTVMDSSGEENRSNDDSDWEMYSQATGKSAKKTPAKKKVQIIIKKESKDVEVRLENDVKTPIFIKKETFSCDHCDKTFTIQRHLKNHCKKVHDVDIDTDFNLPDEPLDRCYECDRCSCSYTRLTALKRHQQKKHGDSFDIAAKPFPCNICFLKFDTKHLLNLHQANTHGKVLNGKEVQYECKTCGETFEKYREFRLHKKQHDLEQQTHICEVCGRVFTRADTLQAHRKFVHMGIKRLRGQKPTEKRFVCELCGSRFFRRSNLNEHFTVKHSNEPLNHRCDHCDKTFNRPSILEYHVNKFHLKQKPYTCEKCGKKSFSKHSLHEHKLICNMKAENKKTCEQCGKLFTSRHNYNLHVQAVHSNPALVCPCGTVVKWRSSVTKHKRRCSLHNSKLLKAKQEPIQYVEQVLDVEDGQVPENAQVVYLQNEIGVDGEVYAEIEAQSAGDAATTVVVSEAEAEVAESVSKLLEAIPGATLAEGGESGVTVVEETVATAEGGAEGVTYGNVSVVTQEGGEGQDPSQQKVYYVIQY